MQSWLLELIVCGGCAGRLAVVPGRAPLVACRRCGARYPVLGGVPVVVPDPAGYLAGYRDATLAALAERGRATRAAVAVVDAFAGAAPRTEPLAFGDDWVAAEVAPEVRTAGGAATPTPAPGDDAARAAFARFLDAAGDRAVDRAVLAALPARPRTVVEVGAGAGVLARRLAAAPGVERLVVADLSLRAALRAPARRPAAGRRRRAAVAAAVLDAEALALAPRSVDAVVAVEIVDLLAAPERLLRAAARALRPRGRLILATPDPSLGTGDDARLRALLAAEGWRVVADRAGLPWIRVHGPRHVQVYFVDVLAVVR
ncbi:MAG: methyltransferase domain-containing protein [Myxococcales bacterium]|nr:methyltransferase domain-containing protein [Myxococcales bacterium]